MISRSWDTATPEERGQDDPYIEANKTNSHDGGNETGRTEHEPVPDTVERDGVAYQVDRCSKCGVIAPRIDDVCRGENHTLDEFADHSDHSEAFPLPTA